ncbi:transport protein (probable substrate zinc/cadmium/cobalt) [Natronomonas pharaonis DSM 2160]|uniref:Transport protein (Probable substrate zinc/cadmium/cobalt) n=1 Tax=Natronomonas pharaonis (strain ATCC 35678 / DSM 2160 / CIP 103997 / JCM 8858 / NBRC 14720 / NCIMB 2260 / Gabara) TaxID=348780 RepID=A0A1U7ETD0_NATPD|nr:cation diffusion facilitator family transporter [Natronomonas pharaonis]CAI48151.1 transport protein (probable substrate zinc/cadmium/cobalt) [Natronomonas pharaonis DSM 2160]
MVSTRLVVVVSLVASAAIAVAKFIAWLATGNASMLSQVYYSLSDVGNQLLFLLGFRLSDAGASRKHPFGRGKEQYVFAFVVTMLLFGVTGYAAVREGYETIGTPARDVDVTINYIVLGVALLFESAAFYKSYQAVREEADTEGFRSLFDTFRRSKDAPLLTAATENLVAVVGVLVALAGVYLTDVTGNTTYDAIGSAVIGLLLMSVALGLAWESRGLLVGEGVTRRERRRLLDAIAAADGVNAVVDLRTMHLGPESVLVACEIDFDNDLDTRGIEAAIDAVEVAVRDVVPEANRIYVEAESRPVTADR